MEIYCVKEVEQNPLPKSQTKPFYIETKEAPSEGINWKMLPGLFIYVSLLVIRCAVVANVASFLLANLRDRKISDTQHFFNSSTRFIGYGKTTSRNVQTKLYLQLFQHCNM